MSVLDDGETAFDFDDGALEPSVSRSLRSISAASFAHRAIPDRPWLVKDRIPRRQVTILGGEGGGGKSLLAIQLGIAVAGGGHWIGTRPEHGGVIYLSAEDEEDEVHRRLIDSAAGAGMRLDVLTDFHLLPLAGRDAILAAPFGGGETLTTTVLWDALVDKIHDLRPRLLILDSLADVFAGNENSRSQARQFIGRLRGLAIKYDLAVLLIAHPSLTGMASGSGLSGSTAWSNSVRSRLYLERAKASDGSEPDPDLRILRVLKANYASVGTHLRIRWTRGFFSLDADSVGTFGQKASEGRADRVFLDLLRAFRDQGRDVSPNLSANYAPTVFADLAEGKAVGKRGLAAAMHRLFQAGEIRVEKHGPPSKQRSRIVVTE